MLNQAAIAVRLAGVQRLLDRVEYKTVCMELRTRQPTIRRAKTSMTKATHCQPCQVETMRKRPWIPGGEPLQRSERANRPARQGPVFALQSANQIRS